MIPKRFIISVIFRSSTIVSAFGIFLLSSYLYGPEGRGIFTLISSFYLTISFALSLGLGRTTYQLIGINSSQAIAAIRTLVTYILFFSLIALTLMILLNFTLPASLRPAIDPKYFLCMAGVLPFYLWQNMSNFLFAARKRTNTHDKLTLVNRISLFVILLTAGFFGASLPQFLLIYGFSCALIFATEAYIINDQSIRLIDFKITMLKEILKKSPWPAMDNLAQAAPPFALFLLGLRIPKDDLGTLSFALQLISALYFPFTILQIKIQERTNTKTLQEASPILKKALSSVLPASLILAATSPIISYLLPLLGLKSFTPSIYLFNLLLLSIPLAGTSCIFQAALTGIHQPKLSSISNLLAGALNIAVTLSLASSIHAKAGIAGIYASYITTIGIQFWFLLSLYSKETNMPE